MPSKSGPNTILASVSPPAGGRRHEWTCAHDPTTAAAVQGRGYRRCMRCPACASLDDKVVDSRQADDGLAIRRRRECLGGVTAEVAQALEGGQVGVHGGRGGEAHRFTDLPHRGRIAPITGLGLDEVEDSSLAFGQVGGHGEHDRTEGDGMQTYVRDFS